jgi:hypothetical protein
MMMARSLGAMETSLLMSLKPAKRAYAAGDFDYIGGAGFANMEERVERADDKAREHLARHGDRSNQPASEGRLSQLAQMYREPLPENEAEVFHRGESFTLGEGVYDLRATMRWLAIVRNRQKLAAWKNSDRTANESGSSYWFVDDAFRISFYRAARALIAAGMLIPTDPMAKGREVRFVSMSPDAERLFAEEE